MDDASSLTRSTWIAIALITTLGWTGCAHLDYSQGFLPKLDKKRNNVGKTAPELLAVVKKEPDSNLRYLAYAKLSNESCYEKPEQKRDAVKTLIAKFDKGAEPTASRAVIVRTLGQLREPSAHELVLRAISDPEPIIRVQACIALGKLGKDQDATVLTRVFTTDTLVDCRVAAIEAIGELKPKDPRIPIVLVNGMQHDEPAIRLASLQALRSISGKDLGVEVGPWAKLYEPRTASAGPSKPIQPPTDSQSQQAALASPLLDPPFEPVTAPR